MKEDNSLEKLARDTRTIEELSAEEKETENKKLVEEYIAARNEDYEREEEFTRLTRARKWDTEGRPRWKPPEPEKATEPEPPYDERVVRAVNLRNFAFTVAAVALIISSVLVIKLFGQPDTQNIYQMPKMPTEEEMMKERLKDLAGISELRKAGEKAVPITNSEIIDSSIWYENPAYQRQIQYRKGVVEKSYLAGRRDAAPFDRKVKLVGEFLFSRKDNEEWSRKIALDMAGRKVLFSLEFDEGKEWTLLKEGLDEYLTDNEDRKLFDLPPIEKAEAKK